MPFRTSQLTRSGGMLVVILNRAKLMRVSLTLVVYFFIANIYSQNDEIPSIRFHHQNGMIIGSKVNVLIYQDSRDKDLFFVNVETSKSKNRYSISREEVLALKEAIYKISPNDVIKEDRSCLDGSDTEIEFSKDIIFFNSVKYSVNCLNSGDDKTVWKDFLNAVNLILDLAKLKFSDLK